MSVRPIVKDVRFLSQKSEPATPEDRQTARDLLDTLKAHEADCVGMAANMIGVRKAIIAVNMGMAGIVLFNPKIVRRTAPYKAEENCLSLTGSRTCTRYQEIEVTYQDMNFHVHRQKFSGRTAQIIQHEVDHLSGILI